MSAGWQCDWPVELSGVTEAVVTTQGPQGRWNLAALGLHAPDAPGSVAREGTVAARTWGDTRTRQNFTERGGGVVQFTRDPVDYVEAALSVRELDRPVLDSAAAHVEVAVERVDAGSDGGTRWIDWVLEPTALEVHEQSVPTIDRGFAAVVEATVAASRLDVAAYDDAELLDRLRRCEDVVDRCGSPAVVAGFDRLRELVDATW